MVNLLEKLANISGFTFYWLSCLIGTVLMLFFGELSIMETLIFFPFSGIAFFPILAVFWMFIVFSVAFLAALWLTFSAMFLDHQE